MDGAPSLPDGLPPGRWVTPDPTFTEDGAVTGSVLCGCRIIRYPPPASSGAA